MIPRTNSLSDALRAYRVGATKTISHIEPRGLTNGGNMCYMNSVSDAFWQIMTKWVLTVFRSYKFFSSVPPSTTFSTTLVRRLFIRSRARLLCSMLCESAYKSLTLYAT